MKSIIYHTLFLLAFLKIKTDSNCSEIQGFLKCSAGISRLCIQNERVSEPELFIHIKEVQEMKVTITKQCMGDRNCNDLCPEVFAYDEDELLSKVILDPIPKHLEDIVRRAASECGADAIIIEE
jgi:ferredoxin